MKPYFFYAAIATITLFATSCNKQQPTYQPKEIPIADMSSSQLIKLLHKKGIYQQVLNYTTQAGIDSTKYATDSTLALFEELGYGHKPLHLKFITNIKPADTTHIRKVLINIAKGGNIPNELGTIEPNLDAYKQLKFHYSKLNKHTSSDTIARLIESMNAYRWINRQAKGSTKMVIVNTRGAYLKGYNVRGKEQISMRVIVGKQATPTPTMDTYATDVVSYPYWNVPRSILENEMLPKIKKDLHYLEKNRLQVVNNKGKVIDPSTINWEEISEENFGYNLRQNTGLDNSLGVVKVTIQNPYSIYLHDTNSRSLFGSDERWRSHGCVRLQNPAQLANFLVGKKLLEDNITKIAISNQTPQTKSLQENIPVFIVYLGADVDEKGQLTFFKDIYGWETNTQNNEKAGE